MTLEDSRLNFRIRANMTEFAFNFRNKKEYSEVSWICRSCNEAIDTSLHAKWCVAHSDLREGKDLNSVDDLVVYIREVLKRREEMKGRRASTVNNPNTSRIESVT